MTNLALTPTWDSVRQLEKTDLVEGGPEGADNIAPKQLGNRGEWLERRLRMLGSTSDQAQMRMRCGSASFVEANKWSGQYSAGVYCAPTFPEYAGQIIFPVTASWGMLVGASVRWAFQGDSVPAVRAKLSVLRVFLDPVNFNYWQVTTLGTFTDATTPFVGARTATVTFSGVDLSDDSANYFVLIETPTNPTAIGNPAITVFVPRAHIVLPP